MSCRSKHHYPKGHNQKNEMILPKYQFFICHAIIICYIPSLFRDLAERFLSVSVFELNESDGLNCRFEMCDLLGDVKHMLSCLSF